MSTKSAYQNPLEEYSRAVAAKIGAVLLEGKLLSHDLKAVDLGKQTMLFSAGTGIDTVCGTCGKNGVFFPLLFLRRPRPRELEVFHLWRNLGTAQMQPVWQQNWPGPYAGSISGARYWFR